MKKGSNIKNSSTLIDVLIHNDDLITDSLVVDCPFSDHKFIAGSIKIEKEIYLKRLAKNSRSIEMEINYGFIIMIRTEHQ